MGIPIRGDQNMWEPPWKTLVRNLTETGFESPYLERLRARVDATPDHRSLERELLQEMARALGRACDKVNLGLLELQLTERRIEEASDAVERTRLVGHFNRQRLRVQGFLRELVIHREALGMFHNDHLKKEYPVPPRKE
jgi:hypothetical protein